MQLNSERDIQIFKNLGIFGDQDLIGQISKIQSISLKLEAIKRFQLPEKDIFKIIKKTINPDERMFIIDSLYDFKGKEILYGGKAQHFKIPFYRDALPKNLFFGTEIECIGETCYALRHYTYKLLDYDVKKEESLKRGVEFTSPKLSWNRECLESIYQICDFAKQNEYYSNELCGGHLHFSSDFLDTLSSWLWLFYLYIQFEPILYLIVNDIGELPRKVIMSHAKPISELYIEILPLINKVHTKEEFIYLIQDIFGIKEYGLDLSHINDKCNTIEFRIPNGSLEANVIIENILLLGNLLVTAKRLSRLSFTRDIYDLIKELERDSITIEEKLEILLKLLFTDGLERSIFRNRFTINKARYDIPYNQNVNLKDCKTFTLNKMNAII